MTTIFNEISAVLSNLDVVATALTVVFTAKLAIGQAQAFALERTFALRTVKRSLIGQQVRNRA